MLHTASSPAPAVLVRPAPRLVMAMSGGVDSSVAALLLREQGHELVGLFMRNGVEVHAEESSKKSCCSVSDARDARMVAAQLKIPFQAVDLKQEFGEVIRYFLREYARGRTPNPCAVCNRDLKFQRLLRFAEELGCAGVATGHYARIGRDEHGRVEVLRGIDRTKDQSYQLFAVREEFLARTHLPLGGLEKSAVRARASQVGLRTAAKKDSQEICFVPGNDYRKLLAARGVELHSGKLVDTAGKVLGEHRGTEHFTVGQRRGHGIGGGEALYVVRTDPDTGTVVLGSREECCSPGLIVEELNWIGTELAVGAHLHCSVQVRYHHTPVAAQVVALEGGRAQVHFAHPEFSVAPGQGAAFYRGERLIGGGWIASALENESAVARTIGASRV